MSRILVEFNKILYDITTSSVIAMVAYKILLNPTKILVILILKKHPRSIFTFFTHFFQKQTR